MPYQPYQSTWTNPYLPQATVPQGYGITQQLPMGYQPQSQGCGCGM